MFNFIKKAVEATTEATNATSEAVQPKDIRPLWKALAAERKITREDIVALCIYRSLRKGEGKEGAISRLQKSFKPITNLVKLENGAYPYGSLESALWRLKNCTFMSWLSESEKQEILSLAKEIKIKGKEIQ